jgi:hypothetical protein
VVEQPVSDPSVLRDVTHAGTVVAVLCEDADRRVEDELALVLLGD